MYYYYCTMWYGAEVILLFFQESWLEALKTRVALQGLNHLRSAFIIILWKLPDFYFCITKETRKWVGWGIY